RSRGGSLRRESLRQQPSWNSYRRNLRLGSAPDTLPPRTSDKYVVPRWSYSRRKRSKGHEPQAFPAAASTVCSPLLASNLSRRVASRVLPGRDEVRCAPISIMG